MNKFASISLLLIAFLFVYMYGEKREKRVINVEDNSPEVSKVQKTQSTSKPYGYSYDLPPTSAESEEVKSCMISFGAAAQGLCILKEYFEASAFGVITVKRSNAITPSKSAKNLTQMPIRIYGFASKYDAGRYLENPDVTIKSGLKFTNSGTAYDYSDASTSAQAFLNIKSYRKVNETSGRVARLLVYELSKTEISIVILAKRYLIVVDRTEKSYLDEYIDFADALVSTI